MKNLSGRGDIWGNRFPTINLPEPENARPMSNHMFYMSGDKSCVLPVGGQIICFICRGTNQNWMFPNIYLFFFTRFEERPIGWQLKGTEWGVLNQFEKTEGFERRVKKSKAAFSSSIFSFLCYSCDISTTIITSGKRTRCYAWRLEHWGLLCSTSAAMRRRCGIWGGTKSN